MTAAALLAALGPVLADGEKTGAVRAKPRLAVPAAPPLPFLVHNGSLMSQVFDPTSGHLLIQYKDPRPGLWPVGVIPGTVLFDGQIQGPVIAGTAFVFSGFCPPTPYRVIGEVLPDGTLVLRGPAPLLDPYSCNVITLVASHNSELVFVPYGEPL
jgi:hypothetical protein